VTSSYLFHHHSVRAVGRLSFKEEMRTSPVFILRHDDPQASTLTGHGQVTLFGSWEGEKGRKEGEICDLQQKIGRSGILANERA